MNTSSWIQIFQEVTSSMTDTRLVFVGKRTAAVAFSILYAFALLVCLDGPVKASSLPAVQPFTDFQNGEVGRHSVEKDKIVRGLDQGVELASFIPIEGKAVAEKKADQSAGEIEFDDFCRRHCKLLFVLVNVFGCFTIGVLLAYIRSYF